MIIYRAVYMNKNGKLFSWEQDERTKVKTFFTCYVPRWDQYEYKIDKKGREYKIIPVKKRYTRKGFAVYVEDDSVPFYEE